MYTFLKRSADSEIGKLTLRLYRERYGYDARPDRQEIIAKEGVSCKVHNVFYT